MKVILVGAARQRQLVRESLDTPPDVVGEFESLADARDAGIAADAILLPPDPLEQSRDDLTIVEPLTPREVDVLELVSEALSNKAIAERLGISIETVKFHLASIMGKLGASNRTDAVRRAVRAGLVTL